MRIACPTCGAVYEVPPERLAPGRQVRCAACNESWAPLDIAPSPAYVPEPVSPAPEAVVEIPWAEPASDVHEPAALTAGPPAAVLSEPPPPQPDSGRLALAGWVLTVIILVAAGWGAVTRRADIMHAWPNSERAYAVIGLGRAAP